MSAIRWRGALIAGLALAAIAAPADAQERELLTLEEALNRTGVTGESAESVIGESAESEANPRIVGPRADADAAR